MALLCSPRSVSANGWGEVWGNGAILHSSSPELRTQGCYSSEIPHRRAHRRTLSCVPVFHQIPTFTLPVSGLSICQRAQHFCVLSQVCCRVSKLQILEPPPPPHRPALILSGRVLLPCGWYPVVLKLVVQPHRGMQFMAKWTKSQH